MLIQLLLTLLLLTLLLQSNQRANQKEKRPLDFNVQRFLFICRLGPNMQKVGWEVLSMLSNMQKVGCLSVMPCNIFLNQSASPVFCYA